MSEYHAVHSPSGAKKRFACPGSLAMEAGLPNEGNDYTDEGTAAHALASMCLKDGSHPSGYLGRVLHVVDGVYVPDADPITMPETAGLRTYTVDVEMAGKVNVYVQSVRKFAEGNTLDVEQALPVGHVSGEEGATGTGDAIIVTADYKELQAHDLKYGMGVEVSAVENEQGLYYLSGALELHRAEFEAIGEMPERFRFVIHQPRLDHLSEWSCSYDELMAWQVKARKAEDYARTALEQKASWIHTEDPPVLVPGEHCKSAFCRARDDCPALDRFIEKSVQCDFEVMLTTAPPVPTDLKELGLKFAVLDIIADWIKQVRARAEGVLFEHNNSIEVQQALGLKLVQGKRGGRAWENKEAAIALLKKMRMKTEEIYDLSVKSPPALEKQLAETPKRWQRILDAKLITQAEGKPSVAPITDKRPALDIAAKGDAFDVVEAGGCAPPVLASKLPDDGSDLC